MKDRDEQAKASGGGGDFRKRLMSCLNHDFRTPLNAVLSLSQILLDRMDGELSPEQEKQVKFIHRAAEDMTGLVNGLLDMARAAGIDSETKGGGAAAEAAAAFASVPERARRILIIDDSDVDRYVFRRMMDRPDVVMLEADSGARGLEMAEKEAPDFIILDMNMPDMDGYEMVRALAAKDATRKIPVVIHSSMVLRDSEREFLNAYAYRIVSKDPEHMPDFRDTIHALLDGAPAAGKNS